MSKSLYQFKTYRVQVDQRMKGVVPDEHVLESVERHRKMDFGIISVQDWEENQACVYGKKDFVVSRFEYINEKDEVIEYTVTTYFDEAFTEIILLEDSDEDLRRLLSWLMN